MFYQKKTRIIPTILSLVFFSSFVFSCNNPGDTHEEPDISHGSEGAKTVVKTKLLTENPFEYFINANGKIKSQYEQIIIAQEGGTVRLFRAITGSVFNGGDIIVQLDQTTIEHKLQRAELSRFNAEKEYESQLLSYMSLLSGKTKEQSDQIKQKLRISTGLSGAEQDIKEAQYDLSKTIIHAPFHGIIANIKIQQGQQLKAGDELFRIYDPENLTLEVKILESDISLLKKGTHATVTLISNSAINYEAQVEEINPYVDENGMVPVLLKININKRSGQNSAALFPGMNCTSIIKIPLGRSITVPKEAIIVRNNRSVVFTVESGKAKWNDVVTGRDNGHEVEILKGLKKGQIIIISNNLQLADDAPVKEE